MAIAPDDSTLPGVAVSHAGFLPLRGGRLALDFTNTASARGTSAPIEHLLDYADLVSWCVQTEIFGPAEAQRLLAEAARHPEEAERTRRSAVELRESMYRIFSSLCRGASAAPDDVARMNCMLAEGARRRQLQSDAGGFCWAWAEDPDGLDGMVWPLAYSAAELLTSGEAGRVKECSGQDCDRLFLDGSRNGSRRWCDMKGCGNRAKARRHYQRSRADGA